MAKKAKPEVKNRFFIPRDGKYVNVEDLPPGGTRSYPEEFLGTVGRRNDGGAWIYQSNTIR